MNRVPQVNVREAAEKLGHRRQGEASFILLDVREPGEHYYASLGGEAENAPLSELAERGVDALPTAVRAHKEAEIIVMCHHGVRSAQVVGWLRQQGWQNVFNLTGGIDAYALVVDPTVGHY
jgi:rhodanese-related sulfurtransferase